RVARPFRAGAVRLRVLASSSERVSPTRAFGARSYASHRESKRSGSQPRRGPHGRPRGRARALSPSAGGPAGEDRAAEADEACRRALLGRIDPSRRGIPAPRPHDLAGDRAAVRALSRRVSIPGVVAIALAVVVIVVINGF